MIQLERTILQILDEARPGLIAEAKLFSETNCAHKTAVTLADFRRALHDLQLAEGGAQVFGHGHRDGTLWTITAAGCARLAP